ncbi:MAG: hypothetical protein H0X66_12710 [Verrucomicrobia bacterium]|nr:hypothetical protein [Verrucomicrobiota bacterium]
MKILNVLAVLAGMCVACCPAHAAEPGEIIINEVYFNARGGSTNHVEAVELLVVADKVNLNGIQISDRDFWGAATEDQCTLQDLGQGFLNEVPSGTLVVIYNGFGADEIDSSNYVLRFWAKSSLFCNVSPTGNATQLGDHGDNLHLLQAGKQLDFVKFRASDRPGQGLGDPGNLGWEKGSNGYIDVGPYRENVGFRFLGDTAELNNYPAAWQVYSETYLKDNNLGKPNGGRNTAWIKSLRGSPNKKDKKK